MKKGLLSSIIISIVSGINLFALCYMLLPFNAPEFLGTMSEGYEGAGGLMILFTAAFIGMGFIVMIYLWMLLVAITHGGCLIFTVKNCKSEARAIRVWNYVLTGLNALLIGGALGKILISLNWEMILNINGMG